MFVTPPHSLELMGFSHTKPLPYLLHPQSWGADKMQSKLLFWYLESSLFLTLFKEKMAIIIESKELAGLQKMTFDLLWNTLPRN